MQCYDEAENPGADIKTLVTKGNAFRKTVQEKEKLICDLHKAIVNLENEKK